MDFELPEEYSELQATARKLARERIEPRARAVDTSGEYPQDFFDTFVDAGFTGLSYPEELGGSDAGILGLVVAIEECAKYSNTASLMLLLSRLPSGPLMIAGSPEQRERFCRPVAEGRQRAAFGLSEPQAGSDVMGMRTRAVRDGGDWILTGTKCWMSGIRQADWYCIFAKTGGPAERSADSISCFILERDSPGLDIGRIDRKMGVRGIDTGELVLDEVRVPDDNVVGDVGGFRLAMLGLNAMRPVVAARGLGLAEGALMYAVDYVQGRAAFERTVADFQGIRWMIAELAVEIEAARLLTYRAALMVDSGGFAKEHVPFLSMAKYKATEVAVRASGTALQMLGAAGYMEDHPLEFFYRDAKQLTIVEGTSQIQLDLIARGVLDRRLWWN